MPDDELLRLAETNKLHQPAMLDAQVKRMIADPKLRRASPTISPASGCKPAASTPSSPMRRSFPSGDPS